MITVNHLTDYEQIVEVRKVAHHTLHQTHSEETLRSISVSEKHQEDKYVHAHAMFSFQGELTEADKQNTVDALRELIPKNSEIHFSTRDASLSKLNYLAKEYLSHPVQHLERNNNKVFASVSFGAWTTEDTKDFKNNRRRKCAQFERILRAEEKEAEEQRKRIQNQPEVAFTQHAPSMKQYIEEQENTETEKQERIEIGRRERIEHKLKEQQVAEYVKNLESVHVAGMKKIARTIKEHKEQELFKRLFNNKKNNNSSKTIHAQTASSINTKNTSVAMFDFVIMKLRT